jgi:hypothetical protein
MELVRLEFVPFVATLGTIFPASKDDKIDDTHPVISKVLLQPLACWDCGFESRRGHGYLSIVSVVFCQVEVTASG